MKKFSFPIIASIIIFTYCTDKFELPTITPGGGNLSDTVYIQQNPIWSGFNKPQDMIVGKDYFLYIADTENDRVVMMNTAGQVIGVRPILKPIAIAQDHRKELIICGQILNNGTYYSAVFKLDLVAADHQIADAPIDTLLPRTSQDFSKPDRQFTGACVFDDNSFYVSRVGPVNSSPVDPDNSIMIFHKTADGGDTLIGRVPLIAPEGTGLVAANKISSLSSFGNGTLDIIVTLTGENSFKTQWLKYVETTLFTGYITGLGAFESDLMQVDKFAMPEGTAIDPSGNIFVADAEKDSIYKFNNFGDEKESFGGSEILNSPHAVAYHDKTLYVLDTNNDRIVRFILSTEID